MTTLDIIRWPPRSNVSFKGLSMWVSTVFHDKIVESFAKECVSNYQNGMTFRSAIFQVPFGEHCIEISSGSSEPAPDTSFEFSEHHNRKSDIGDFQGLALSQRRAEDAVNSVRREADNIELQ